MASVATVGDPRPVIRVVRHSFFPLPGGERSGHLRWIESSPREDRGHDEVTCSSMRDVAERPAGDPFDVRQEVRLSWPDCSIAVEGGISEPWVTFRRAGDVDEWRRRRAHGTRDDEDRDHAHFIFDARQRSAKVEVASEGIPLTGVLLTNLLVGNQIDVSRLLDGVRPSEVVKLADISADQVWLHAAPWLDAMRTICSPDEAAALRRVIDLAADVRKSALPRANTLDVGIEEVRTQIGLDLSLLRAAAGLRRALAPFAFEVQHTEMFRRACEMYSEEVRQARRPSLSSGPRRPARPR